MKYYRVTWTSNSNGYLFRRLLKARWNDTIRQFALGYLRVKL